MVNPNVPNFNITPPKRDLSTESKSVDERKAPPFARKDFKEVYREARDEEKAAAEKKPKDQSSSMEQLVGKKDKKEKEETSFGRSKSALKKDKESKTGVTLNRDEIYIGDDEEDTEIALGDEETKLAQGEIALPEETVKGAEEQVPKEPPVSPWAMYSQMTGKKSSTKGSSVNSREERKEKQSIHFNGEQSDFAAINPLGSNYNPVAAANSEKSTPEHLSPSSQIQAIVEKLVDRLQVIEKSGEKDTVIVLRQPPIFAGSRIVVTSFDSATREFNLAFENLRPDAKQLLDNNLAQLQAGLQEKGYANAIHIITTTTQIEHRIPIETETHHEGGHEEGQQQRRQQQQEETEE